MSWLAGVVGAASVCWWASAAAAQRAPQARAYPPRQHAPGRGRAYDARAMSMTHAVVLIEAERDALSTLGGELADIDGVAEAYSVTGEWDFVAIVRVPHHEQLADVVTGQIGDLPGRRADADDGRLHRLLPSRSRGDVLRRRVAPSTMPSITVKPASTGRRSRRMLAPPWRAASRARARCGGRGRRGATARARRRSC